MKHIGMVGSSKASLDNEVARNVVRRELQKFDPKDTVIVSGAGKGIDTIVAQEATAIGFTIIEYAAKGYGWAVYKKRNEQIAEKSDRIISFVFTLGYTKGVPKCYHCENAQRDDNHEKTAGCWTGKENGNYEVVIIQ
tara:strand:- start:41 stop:451 length:411 start_codon:yes stop_codon:yes gene_type:complete